MLFLLFAANFVTAVVMNAYLRALGDDGDACKVLRAHENLLSVRPAASACDRMKPTGL